MHFKPFRSPRNDHPRMVQIQGRFVGGRGLRLQSKLGAAISLNRLQDLLAEARQKGGPHDRV